MTINIVALVGEDPKDIMLFDLEADPSEQHDVSSQHPDVVKRLKTIYEKTVAAQPLNEEIRSQKSESVLWSLIYKWQHEQ